MKAQEAEMALQKAIEDSLRMKAMQDSMDAMNAKLKKASAPKPAPKKSPEQKIQEQQIKEVKDATRGRG